MNGLRSLVHEDQKALALFLSEFDADPSELHGYFCKRDQLIEDVVTALDAWEREEELPLGWVPSSTRFWIENEVIMGVINVRHYLTPGLEEVGGHIGYSVSPAHRCKGIATYMLKGALEHCRSLGLSRILLTCASQNIASWKVIERNGGILEREEWSDRAQKIQRWYWIDCA